MQPDPLPRPTPDPLVSGAPIHVIATSLLQLLDISPDALLVVDREGTMAIVNEQLAALFGWNRPSKQYTPRQ